MNRIRLNFELKCYHHEDFRRPENSTKPLSSCLEVTTFHSHKFSWAQDQTYTPDTYADGMPKSCQSDD